MPASLSRRPAFVRIVRLELHFFWRYPRLLLAALVVVLIPALYVLIYLSSVWDPASKTSALPVGLVNLDQGLVYRQQAFNVGLDVVERLKRKPTFGYQELSDEAEARALVQTGQLAFSLIVPADFSSNAIPGAQTGAGRLVVFSSEGNNYTSANLARHFADDLGREVNQSLNEQRWALVLDEASGSQRNLQRLHEGLQQLRLGAQDLASGAGQVDRGAQELVAGTGEVGQGVTGLVEGAKNLSGKLRAMHAQRPRHADLKQLDDGAKALVDGHRELASGLRVMQSGIDGLQSGIAGFKAQAADSALVPQAVTQGLNQLGSGVVELDAGTGQLVQGQQKLSDGALRLADGVNGLTQGTRTMKTALRSMVDQLPANEQLNALEQGTSQLRAGAHELSAGTRQVLDGSQHLSGGLALLEDTLPQAAQTIEGNASGLASSVRPVLEVVAAVRNNGSGFAPNIVPGALWLGASMVAFLFHLRALPRGVAGASAWSKMLGKLVLPLLLVLAQAAMVWLCLRDVLGIQIHDAWGLINTLGWAALTFLLLIYAMTRALGDVGKALALVLLAVQLSSSGGLLPVQLSGGWFAIISDYLPITWVVTALKASLFGAFDSQWLPALHALMLVAAVSAVLAAYLGRWRYVHPAGLRPNLDI